MKTTQTTQTGKSALGRGLASLITPGTTAPSTKKTVLAEASINTSSDLLYLCPKDIAPNPYQPRKEFKAIELEELSQSIKEQGLLQPLVVQKNSSGTGYELIAGERRLRASKLAKLDKIPVIVKTASDRGKLLLAIMENVQRSELSVVDEARAYMQLIEEFGLSQEMVAQKVGKSRSTIANLTRVLQLPHKIVQGLQSDKISFGHAKVLMSLEGKTIQLEYYDKILDKKLSVRELEEVIKKEQSKSKNKKQKAEDNPEVQKRLRLFKDNLESRTGLHFDVKWDLSGPGNIQIKFTNQEEFNKIYEFLLKK